MTIARVLIIAGSDSGGGAGIQADIKTVAALGGYAMTAVTAVTAQNTQGVAAIHEIPSEIVAAQIAAVFSDLGADAIKIGMLGSAALAEEVARALAPASAPVVIDPVMTAKGGAVLLAPSAVEVLKTRLLPRAALVTPNAPEAALLTGQEVRDIAGQQRAGEALVRAGAKAALVKGGHIAGDLIRDVLVSPAGVHIFESPRIETRATHGTGCTLSSAIATLLAQRVSLEEAIEAARAYLHEAIRSAERIGAGFGPVDHGWLLRARSS